ncbi:MAG TPA: outer membrane protein transport protein [Bacteroidales bacterium]
MRKITILLTSILFSMSVFAGGYQVRLQGNKQTGMGLIGTPLNMGASSMFYNPGALSMMKTNWSFDLGASFILATATFEKSESDYTASSDNPVGTPFYFYGAGKINKLIALGVAVYTPFGSSAKWEDDWAGNLLVQNIDLQAIYIQPTISFNINDKLGIGGGFIYAMGNVELNKALNYSDANGQSTVNLQGNGSNLGYNIGVFFKPVENWAIAVDYRSEIMMNVEDGDAIFDVPSALEGTIPPTNTFSAELPLPANLDVGVAVQATKKLLIAIEFDWTFWSVYDSLKFTFAQAGDLLNSSSPREYHNAFIPRIGFEYAFSEKFQLRIGGYYDASPTNPNYFTPETVSLNTAALTAGFSWYPVKNLGIDFSILQLFGQQSQKNYAPDNFGGTYKTNTTAPGIGISYSF